MYQMQYRRFDKEGDEVRKNQAIVFGRDFYGVVAGKADVKPLSVGF